MTYSGVNGPNTLADFLMEGLSEETMLRIYLEKKDVMFMCDDMCDDPVQLLKSHVHNLFYTAGFNFVSNMQVDGHITELTADQIYNQ